MESLHSTTSTQTRANDTASPPAATPAQSPHFDTLSPSLTVLTWNVNGLGDKIKRGLVLQHIKRQGPAIAMLQETHLTGTACSALDRWGYKMVIHSDFTTGSRGVGILISKKFPLIVMESRKDELGRFAAVTGQWEGRIYNFVSVYIPPALHKTTLPELGKFLLALPQGELIMGGDFNATMDDTIDRQPPHITKKGSNMLREFSDALGLVDVWREKCPQAQQYSFFSGVHNSLSRIDYLFTLAVGLEKIRQVTHLPRVISDHSPIILTYTLYSLGRKRIFPIYSSYLKNLKIRKHLIKSTEQYFQENTHSVISPTTLWEAYKTVIRGHAISLITGHKKANRKHIVDLELNISQAEAAQTTDPSDTRAHTLNLVQQEYRAYTWEEAKLKYTHTQHKIYELGDKAGKLLAWLDTRERSTRWVAQLRLDSGELTTDPQLITEVLAKHYEKIYTNTSTDTIEDNLAFMKDIRMPKLTADDIEALETDLTTEELILALNALAAGKAVGPNGIPVELYKQAASQLIPPLLNMYTDSLKNGILPRNQRVATIVAIHKTGKPPEECSSYRPISLINAESKILAKTLAMRLQPYLTTLIHPDQSGFMPNRNTALNLRRLLAVIARRHTIEEDAVILSLDAHMAFDLVTWPFLFAVLKNMGFGPRFCAWIQLLYTQPLAHVAVNGRMSADFPLGRGTRQGCPLSPLLFALVLEPLAVWIRQDPIIRGLKWA